VSGAKYCGKAQGPGPRSGPAGAGWSPWPWRAQDGRFVAALDGYLRLPWTGTYRRGPPRPLLPRAPHCCAAPC
jgi:hypothetical protein